MTSQFELDIAAFHQKFGLEYNGPPRLLPSDLAMFRIKFLQEELNELCEGYAEGNLEKAFDALIDLVYVALGTSYMMGLPFYSGWNEVQEANMQKVRAKEDGSDSKRGHGADVVKPEGWTPPSLTRLLELYQATNYGPSLRGKQSAVEFRVNALMGQALRRLLKAHDEARRDPSAVNRRKVDEIIEGFRDTAGR
jgi:predicted HAD superfamily Cof-like phosphohydrolase